MSLLTSKCGHNSLVGGFGPLHAIAPNWAYRLLTESAQYCWMINGIFFLNPYYKDVQERRAAAMNSLLPFCDPKQILTPLASPSSLFLPESNYSLYLKAASGISRVSVKPSQNLNPSKWGFSVRARAPGEIDMVRDKDGVYEAMREKVVVHWDLDNKPPRGQPYEAALALIEVAQRFGDIVNISAYTNRHAFVDLPQWVLAERTERRRMDVLERKGILMPDEPCVCGVCGRKCRTNLDLKKHFKQLHQRGLQKKYRMTSLKCHEGKFISGNTTYEEAARLLLIPKVGHGVPYELRRAGVFVKTVDDKPQAVDCSLQKQMQHSLSRGIDWLFMVSDDSGFANTLSRARESILGTVVVGDWNSALGSHADLWVPWARVESREVTDDDLRLPNRSRNDFEDGDDSLFSVAHFTGEGNDNGSLDSLVDKLVVNAFDCNGGNVSAFSRGGRRSDGTGIRGGEPYSVPSWPISWRR